MEITKTTSLTATSVTPDEAKTPIAYFNASVATDGGNSNVSMNIQNQQLYDINKKQVRADLAAFTDAVYAVEDAQ